LGFNFKGYAAAWDRHDTAAVGSFFTSDGTYTDVPLRKTLEGPAGIAGFVEESLNEFSSDFRFELKSSGESERGYAMEWTMSGTHDRSSKMPPLPATGKAFEIRGVSVGTLEGSKIAANRDYWDVATFLRQVGILPGR